eukprot:m.132288 g.132288  ORF g.132288 m.132288 type:complete len:409 (+) comp15773_c2_seq2:724-1950(+)
MMPEREVILTISHSREEEEKKPTDERRGGGDGEEGEDEGGERKEVEVKGDGQDRQEAEGRHAHRRAPLGFGLIGAVKQTTGDHMKGVYVSRVDADCTGDLHVGDQLLTINTPDWTFSAEHAALPEVLDQLKVAVKSSIIKLVVRPNPEGFAAFEKVLEPTPSSPFSPTSSPPLVTGSKGGSFATLSTSSSTTSSRPATSSPLNGTRRPDQNVNTEEGSEERHVQLGIEAMTAKKFREAEAHFNAALQVTLDAHLQAKLASLATMDDAVSARKIWQRELDQIHRHKGYIHYLRGLNFGHMKQEREAQQSMAEAAKVLMPWYYHPGLLVNLSDPDFHHTVSRVLLNRLLYEPAIIALQETEQVNGVKDAYKGEIDFARQLLARQQQAQTQDATQTDQMQPQETEGLGDDS